MFTRLLLASMVLTGMSSFAAAHFPWLATDEEGRAIMFFGESIAERSYHLPEAVEKAEVVQVTPEGKSSVTMDIVEEDDFIGRRSKDPIKPAGTLQTKVAYGVYHGAKLTYYVQHSLAVADTGGPVESLASPELQANLKPAPNGGVAVQVLWQGKPLEDAEVKLFCEEGHEEGAAKTDAAGWVKFDGVAVEPGLNALMVGFEEPNNSGEINGKPYTMASNYLTATFQKSGGKSKESKAPHAKKSDNQKSDAKKNEAKTASGEKATGLPPLPAPIASFGGAVADGWLYVYSGHTGETHVHSRDNLSGHFCRLNLDGGTAWETLPMQQPLQGLPLVAHDGKLYRIGGLNAKNATGDEDDLHSVDTFARFDPASKKWESLASLPEPRSSHDAVVIGDKIYVVGGWTLSGSDEGDWLNTAWVFDLKNPAAGWQSIPSPSFQRRALALASLDGQLVVLGGMDSERSVTGRVDAFDPATGKWSELASFPAEGFEAFGISAWNMEGALYACGMDGALRRLATVDGEWQDVGEIAAPRFFHRLLPAGEKSLVIVAGASPKDGHLATIERVSPSVE